MDIIVSEVAARTVVARITTASGATVSVNVSFLRPSDIAIKVGSILRVAGDFNLKPFALLGNNLASCALADKAVGRTVRRASQMNSSSIIGASISSQSRNRYTDRKNEDTYKSEDSLEMLHNDTTSFHWL